MSVKKINFGFLFKKFSKKTNNDDLEDEEIESNEEELSKEDNEDIFNEETQDDEENSVKKNKIKFSKKEIIIVVASTIILSFLFLLILNVSGSRTAIRTGIVNILIENERKILITEISSQYENEYEEKLQNELSKERETLVLEYELLAAKKEELEVRELGIVTQENNVQELEISVEIEKNKFIELYEDLKGRIEQVEDLSKIYVNMEPENAASILSAMEDNELMLSIFKKMKSEDAAKIFELMETQKAADIINELGN